MPDLKLIVCIIGFASLVIVFGGGSTFVNANETIIFRGESIAISARLLQNGTYGDPITNQKVEFFDETINMKIGEGMTNQEGYVTIQWTIPLNHPLGETFINATFRGNSSLFLAPTFQRSMLVIYSHTEIRIMQVDTYLAPGDDVHLQAQLLMDSETPIAYANISIFVNNKFLLIETTNSTGKIVADIEYNPAVFTLGKNNIRFVFHGNTTLYYYESSSEVTIEYQKLPLQILEVQPMPEKVILNNTISISVLVTSEGTGVSGLPLDVTVDGKIINTTYSNNDGSAVLEIPIDSTFSIGRVQMTIRFSGNYRYLGAELQEELEIYCDPIFNMTISNRIIIGSATSLIVNVADQYNRPFENAIICLKDPVSNYTLFENTDNLTQIAIPYLASGQRGIRRIEVAVLNQPYLITNSWNITIEVWSQPEFKLLQQGIFGFASPSQKIELIYILQDMNGEISAAHIILMKPNGTVLESYTTDDDGTIKVQWNAPSFEGNDQVCVVYPGKSNSYYLPTNVSYSYYVSRTIPIRVQLISYEIVIPLREISVHALLFALNGTNLQGIEVKWKWIGQWQYVVTNEKGHMDVALPLPMINGTYYLEYTTTTAVGVENTQGRFNITVQEYQVLAAEGVGISGMTASSILSVFSITIPVIRKKYLIGT